MPVQAGIQGSVNGYFWIPAFAGVDGTLLMKLREPSFKIKFRL
jgi:hypothetical protein